jgi:Na+-driven multidrug efflux pump
MQFVPLHVGAAWMAVCALLIVLFRRSVGKLFVGAGDTEVVNLVAKIAPFAAVFQVRL